jgi:hypothetical protein
MPLASIDDWMQIVLWLIASPCQGPSEEFVVEAMNDVPSEIPLLTAGGYFEVITDQIPVSQLALPVDAPCAKVYHSSRIA